LEAVLAVADLDLEAVLVASEAADSEAAALAEVGSFR
jgi:hypothetical protein